MKQKYLVTSDSKLFSVATHSHNYLLNPCIIRSVDLNSFCDYNLGSRSV